MRHALEPDHLAAVSTMVSRERNGLRAAWLGICWGLGHTTSLVVVGAVLVVMRAEMPASMTNFFEFAVAVMLVGLGGRAIVLAARQGPDGPLVVHRHGTIVHRHASGTAHVHVGHWTLARRPLLIGALHGLAGSGALMPLVLTTLPTNAARVAYLVLFGAGSTLGHGRAVRAPRLAARPPRHPSGRHPRHLAAGGLRDHRSRRRLGLSADRTVSVM